MRKEDQQQEQNQKQECPCLIHPFQNDPGTSQRQRVMEDLLDGAARIDARTLADLLDYFMQMSRHINYYDLEMNINDWQPFFRKSLPFTLAGIIKFPLQNAEDSFSLYNSLFEKQPSAAGLQLNIFFLYHRFIRPINDWHLSVQDSDLPLLPAIEQLIKNKLQQPVSLFIKYAYEAVRYFEIKKLNFAPLYENSVWNIKLANISDINTDFSTSNQTRHARINRLNNDLKALLPILSGAVKRLAMEAAKNLEQSFIPLKEDLQKQHQPHLAVLFTFLNMFRQVQDDLNQYTRKHLDYFYKDILHFKSAGAVADKTHIIFEIQKQLKSYLLKKGLKVKDGKDEKGQEILFSLDDDIVVTQTTIADKRTLFVNNETFGNGTYVEGVYMAPTADKADGVEVDFKEEPKNYYTVGGKYSKFQDPETKLFKPYPNARLGFVLASPVLYMQEGSTRTVEINLACEINPSLCGTVGDEIIKASQSCCNDLNAGGTETEKNRYPNFYPADGIYPKDSIYPAVNFYDSVNAALSDKYFYLSLDILKEATKRGVSIKMVDMLKELFLVEQSEPLCYCQIKKLKYDTIEDSTSFKSKLDTLNLTLAEAAIIADLIKPRKALNLLFSGEKEWIEPSEIIKLEILPIGTTLSGFVNTHFNLHIVAKLNPDKAAIIFYDKEKLKEELGTTQPLVKIELDDKIKFNDISFLLIEDFKDKEDKCCVQDDSCCLIKHKGQDNISLYHFFRNVLVDKIEDVNKGNPIITVQVCGLRNFIVQNDEAVMDVNGQIYPFGARPDIVDSNAADGLDKYFLTPQLIEDANAAGVDPSTATALNSLIPLPPKILAIGGKEENINKFLGIHITVVPLDIPTVKNLLLTNNYGNKNLIGPNFFIGSKEIFCKHWTKVFVNFNWKDKPSNFSDYYQGYVALEDSIDDQEYQVNLSVLENGKWMNELKHPNPSPGAPYPEETTIPSITGFNNRKLFPKIPHPSSCQHANIFQESIYLENTFFTIADKFTLDAISVNRYDVDTLNGFMRINLQNQDFLHNDYSYVLARQMNAAAMLGILDKKDNPVKVEGAVYYDKDNKNLVVFNSSEIQQKVTDSVTLADNVREDINGGGKIKSLAGIGLGPIVPVNAISIRNIIASNLSGDANKLKQNIHDIDDRINSGKNFQAIIPKEPWTPIISSMILDYIASATVNDVDLIHLYPYPNTYKPEEISLQPPLFPTFCDEGTLFLGLKDLVPGDNLNILFQLAEATSDSESDPEDVWWYYLDSNVWKPLRKGFEVLDDATKNLTTSGIIKLALPANMTKDNTVMPKEFHWIKAAIAKNSKAVGETIAIIPQAMLSVFTNQEANDKLRLANPLKSESISKLSVADASVKSVAQPFDSFGGAVPENESLFYVRVSETLRHKGRAIQAFDYERIVLQAFPELFKAKCINHSFALNAHQYKNDFPFSPGYVMLAVIPDLFKLKAGNSFEPKVPVSIIEDIEKYLQKRTSPFVRFRAMNPRYEKINFCIRVQLVKGKDENYFKEKLKQDIRELLAPWAVGKYDKLTFGQCIYRSDIIRLLETSGYVDFITDFRMGKANSEKAPDSSKTKICPDTPRSILIAGDIEVCIDKPDCKDWEGLCDTKPQLIIDYCKKDKKETS